MKRILNLFSVSVLAFCASSVNANLIVTSSTDATALANVLTVPGSGITISSPSLIGIVNQQGTFTGGLSSGLSIDTGLILTNGNATLASGPVGCVATGVNKCNTLDGTFNQPSGLTGLTGTGSNALLNALTGGFPTFDQNVLSFTFTSTTGNLFFKFQFASEEYNEFVNFDFNDVFGFFVDGVNIATIPGTNIPVKISTINCGTDGSTTTATNHCNLFTNNSQNVGGPFFAIQYDGFTHLLDAQVLGLSAGPHIMTLAIADVEDDAFDSAVFLPTGSFTAGSVTVVPEPASLALLAIGLAGLGAMRRRKTA